MAKNRGYDAQRRFTAGSAGSQVCRALLARAHALIRRIRREAAVFYDVSIDGLRFISGLGRGSDLNIGPGGKGAIPGWAALLAFRSGRTGFAAGAILRFGGYWRSMTDVHHLCPVEGSAGDFRRAPAWNRRCCRRATGGRMPVALPHLRSVGGDRLQQLSRSESWHGDCAHAFTQGHAPHIFNRLLARHALPPLVATFWIKIVDNLADLFIVSSRRGNPADALVRNSAYSPGVESKAS